MRYTHSVPYGSWELLQDDPNGRWYLEWHPKKMSAVEEPHVVGDFATPEDGAAFVVSRRTGIDQWERSGHNPKTGDLSIWKKSGT